jgi:hypothetical protein
MSQQVDQDRREQEQVLEYQLLWRNKFLTSDCRSLEDMIAAFQSALETLKSMQTRGVKLREDGGVADDYATLITADPAVASEFGFERFDIDGEDDSDLEFDEFIIN